MRRSHALRACLLSLAFIPTLMPIARAQDTFRLEDKSAVGDVSQTEDEFRMEFTMKVSTGGTSLPPIHTSNSETQKYQTSLLAKNAKGDPDALRRTYTVYREVNKDEKGEKTTISPLQGKTVTIQRKGKQVVVTSPSGPLPKEVCAKLDDALSSGLEVVPDHAVAIGDEWEVDPKRMERSGLFKDAKNVTIQVKLLEITSFGGHRCARLHLTLHAESSVSKDLGIKLNIEGDGYLALDIQRLISVDMQGPVAFSGSDLGGGATLESGEGTAHVKLTHRWLKVAGKPVAADKPVTTCKP